MRNVAVLLAAGSLLAAVTFGRGAEEPSLEGMAVPVYNAKGELVRPEGYHEWIFVGASLGLRYAEEGPASEEEADGPGTFHHVYIQPEAYRFYKQTGRFPEKTILVLETYSPGSRESIGRAGYFEKDRIGVSAAVKDRERYPEGWGYVSFLRPGGTMKAAGGPFPKSRCYDCHREHGADDNVFTQFYPILRRDGAGAP